jgi:Esterase-like activity of phytase
MIRFWLTMIGFVPLFLLSGSEKRPVPLAEVPSAPLEIEARAVLNPVVVTQFPFHFVKAWTLSSPNRDFGSVSAMMRDSIGFTTISDHGAIVRFKMTADGNVFDASTSPLPRGCALDELKTSRDAESVSRDPQTRDVLIGFEWTNAICRSDARLARAVRRTSPPAMRSWPILGGAEALVTLRDGRTLVFAEQRGGGGATSPLIIFDRDPTLAKARATALSYRPPTGFRPTDAAQLPDGRIVIVNRRYEFPLNFSAVITVTDLADFTPGAVVTGKIVVRLEDPSIADNYEAIAVSQNGARTFVWLMSDDNFIAYQSTYLVLLEVQDANARPAKSN